MSPLPRFSIGFLPIQFPQLPYHQTLWAAPLDPFWPVLRPQLRGPRMMAILASGAQLTRAVAHLGGLGVQLLNLSLASFALQLIIVALAIWHCSHCNTGTRTRTESKVGDTETLSWGILTVLCTVEVILSLMAVESCTGLKGTLINSKLRLRLCE